MKQRSADKLKDKMKQGLVYRREELKSLSKTVDRNLNTLVVQGNVKKVGPGLYYRPKTSVYGPLPPEDREVVRAFLKNDDFLLTSPNYFNALGLGLTQLYNELVVYNHKRHEKVNLAGKTFDFRRQHKFPKKVSEELLLVDLFNNLKNLAEDTTGLEVKVRQKAKDLNLQILVKAARDYGKVATRKFFEGLARSEQQTIST